ncbi:MAG: type III-B CRISPR module-associated protein Cmr5 [Hydrogenobaculum sp.]|nr:MAG: type III-B CRISPR module-associated protein Cmr5 [Hydrogenobaculum sp.]HEK25397.1 type III-B CRISPR module-associated protein Cmr5 [Hydrogenobaculum sp.]
MNKTLEQQRSKYAFDCILHAKGKSFESEFSSLVARFPTLVLTNGLGNTLAYLLSKGKEHHMMLVCIIASWVMKEKSPIKDCPNGFNTKTVKANQGDIIKHIVLDTTVQEYIYYTEEVLRLANWLKRYAEAMLEKKEEVGNE